MIKKRLKELEIKITELANYLQISRPTIYKFIESYDSGNKKDINPSILKLFNYIEDSPLIGKRNVINYILTNMADVKDVESDETNEILRVVKSYVSNNPDSEKTQFIRKCSAHSQFDVVIHYLIDISSLIKKKRLTKEEEEKLKPYKDIVGIYTESK